MSKRIIALLLVAGVALMLSGCSDDDGAIHMGTCQGWEDHLRDCGLVTGGYFRCFVDSGDDETLCTLGCWEQASCADLEAIFCAVGNISTDYMRCINRCYSTFGYECPDGSGDIPLSWVCDGENDCDDGSDEAGCTPFECTDHSDTLPQSWVCDGVEDCTDGSDEEGCPVGETFACDDGLETVRIEVRCNGVDDCTDGSDELDCADYTCNNP